MTNPFIVTDVKLPEIQAVGTITNVLPRRLGRHVKHDVRSRKYPAKLAPSVVSVKHQSAGLPLDQDLPIPIGSCTANALLACCNSEPTNAGLAAPYTEADAIKLYSLETTNESSPYPPNDPGGSGLAVCQAAVSLGMITSYDHAFGIDQALKALVVRPVITGISWFDSFDQPDPNGVIHLAPGAVVRGGHEVMADEIDAANKLVWFWNSWGLGYGIGGRFAMAFDLWDTLLQGQGDVTVPIR